MILRYLAAQIIVEHIICIMTLANAAVLLTFNASIFAANFAVLYYQSKRHLVQLKITNISN
jgi:hypothetical protein